MKRAVVQVVGPPGAGATMLIERLLRSNRSRWMCAVRIRPPGDREAAAAERERYAAAGAMPAVVVDEPEGVGASVWEALQGHEALLACDVVLLEGGPVGPREVDLVVFVAPPLAAGEPLLVEERREVGRVDGETALAFLLGLDPNRASDVPDEIDEEDVEVVETYALSDREAAAMQRLLDEGLPSMRDGAWLRDGWEPIADADLAVVNVRPDDDPAAVHATRAVIEGLRADARWQVGAAARRRDAGPRRCHVGDLSDPRDDGARRLIDAIKRRWA